MTTEADTHLATDDPALTPTATAEDQAKGPLFTAPIEEMTDPDDIALRDALAAAKAEETAGQGTKPDGVTDGASPAEATTETKPDGTKPPAKADVEMIPKPRFDQMTDKANKNAQDAAYWRGRAEANQPQPGTAGANGAPPIAQTPEQKLAAVRTEKQALAARFDAGELTMSDYEVQRDALDDKVTAIREESLLAKVRPAAPATGDALTLATMTTQLEAAHPWLDVFEKVGTDAEWGFLKTRAIENLVARGIDPTNGSVGTWELRQEMAKLTSGLGPVLLKDRAVAQGIALPGQPTPATPQQGQQPLSPQALALKAKLETQQRSPPNLASMTGTTGTSTGLPSDAQIEAMDEADYDKLPTTTRNKLLGISA